MHAAAKGRVDCVRLLIDAGADKDAVNMYMVRVVRYFDDAPFGSIFLFVLF